jgi:hypothetical protein
MANRSKSTEGAIEEEVAGSHWFKEFVKGSHNENRALLLTLFKASRTACLSSNHSFTSPFI